MADLIDRDALKETISNIKLRVKNPEMMSGLVEMKAATLREVEAAPTIEAEPVNRWIPCSERLPEQGQRVIVQFRYGKDTSISTARRTHSGSWTVDCMRYADKECVTIQAWMPMPDAYEPPEKE